jgi:L-lactate dehydrogenase
MSMTIPRYDAESVRAFARTLFERAGLASPMAGDVAEILVEGDLLGHTTHGLALASVYLREIEGGVMARDGAPQVVAARGAVQTWDGMRLAGPWLTLRALDAAAQMARLHGTGTVVIRHSHHIGCLAAYLERYARQGMLVLLSCSDPGFASVAPHGGTQAVISPNPVAAGIPTDTDPILIDVSMSTTAMGFVRQCLHEGRPLPHPWLLDHAGRPSADPQTMFTEPKSTILPLGGMDAGHKGYALGLLVEALTSGLAGEGRAEGAPPMGANVCAQAYDPDAFGGGAALRHQMSWLADACHASPTRPGADAVRVPGERGLATKRHQLAAGIALHPTILPALTPWAQKFGLALPAAMAPAG